jgi:pyruvate/2-oxoglutarate dehydrogenase complex dihydrolipoamide dehydrogenase (E3) component
VRLTLEGVMTAVVGLRMIKSWPHHRLRHSTSWSLAQDPAGVVAALRAARLGASTALITRDQFGGMAANDGPVPVRTLAQAARLIREARQLPLYGIAGGEPSLDYARLLERRSDSCQAARW